MADEQNSQQDRTQPPTKSDLKLLPRWARVAFASRCARRVQPLFVKSWPNAPAEHVAAVDRAIELAESSARVGRADDSHSVVTSVLAAARAADSANADSANAAYAALAAARAALAVAVAAGSGAAAAVAAAVAAVAADAAITRCMWFDYDLLAELAKLNAWTDDSPVDPDLCGVLWPFGKLEGWPSDPEKPDDAGGLKVSISLPDDVSDEDAERYVVEYVSRLDDLHRALGGKGLRLIRPVEASQSAATVQGVGS